MRLLAANAVVLSLLAASPVAVAQQAVEWPVHHRLVGKDGTASKNISGIACTTPAGFPRRCLVIDDNRQAAQQVTLLEGSLDAGGSVALIDNMWQGEPIELDGEGIAFADGLFYVIGSHGHPRDAKHKLDPVADRDQIDARIAAASQIVPLRVERDGKLRRQPALTLSTTIAAQPELQSAMGRRLDANGLTIEGIAVSGDRLLAGCRGPSLLGGRAAVLDVSLASLGAGGSPVSRLFKLPLGEGRGVRDLAPFAKGFLVLAGPTGSGSEPYELFAWDGASDDGVHSLGDITRATAAFDTRKPEAILPLDGGGTTQRVLILLDGAKEGDPTVLTVKAP